MSTVMTEAHGKLTVLRQITDSLPHLSDPLISNPTLGNFEPRVGFSWDPMGDGKTAVSGGFGIFDVLPLPYLFQMNELFSAPFFESASARNLAAGTYPVAAYAALTASTNTLRQAYFAPKPGRNYVMQWNLTMQHELLEGDRKSTRLNSSHGYISYAVFCLKKKKIITMIYTLIICQHRDFHLSSDKSYFSQILSNR